MTRKYALEHAADALLFREGIGRGNCRLWVELLAHMGAEVSERDIFDALEASPLWRHRELSVAGEWEPGPWRRDYARARIWDEVVQTAGLDAFTAIAARVLERFLRRNYSVPRASTVERWKAAA